VTELSKLAVDRGVRYFLVSFSDLRGVQRAKLVPATAIDKIAQEGAGFAGFATWLDMSPADADMFAMADPSCVIQPIELGSPNRAATLQSQRAFEPTRRTVASEQMLHQSPQLRLGLRSVLGKPTFGLTDPLGMPLTDIDQVGHELVSVRAQLEQTRTLLHDREEPSDRLSTGAGLRVPVSIRQLGAVLREARSSRIAGRPVTALNDSRCDQT
jgi:hypothetical protein